MTIRLTSILLVGIMVVACFLRLFQLATTPTGLYIDEAMDGNNALEVLDGGQMKIFYPEDNGREGLYINLLVPLIAQFGNEPWVLRFPAALAGIATVLGIFFFAKELFNKRIALVAALLLATSFWHINFSRLAFRGILAPLFLVWALYFLLRSIRTRKPIIASLLAVVAGCMYGVGFYTYIAYRITPFLFLFFIFFFFKNSVFWKRFALFFATTCLIALPLAQFFIQHPSDFFGRTNQISFTHDPNPGVTIIKNIGSTLQMFVAVGDKNWRHNISGTPQLNIFVGILFVIGLFYAIAALANKRYRSLFRMPQAGISVFSLWLLIGWFVLALLPAAASNEGVPHALRSILMLPPAILFACIGGFLVWQYAKIFRNEKIKKGVLIGITAFLIVTSFRSYFIDWAKNSNVPDAFGKTNVDAAYQIRKLSNDSLTYVVVAQSDVFVQGISSHAASIMYLTRSYTPAMQKQKNIVYIPESEKDSIPKDIPQNRIFFAQ